MFNNVQKKPLNVQTMFNNVQKKLPKPLPRAPPIPLPNILPACADACAAAIAAWQDDVNVNFREYNVNIMSIIGNIFFEKDEKQKGLKRSSSA